MTQLSSEVPDKDLSFDFSATPFACNVTSHLHTWSTLIAIESALAKIVCSGCLSSDVPLGEVSAYKR